jgi:hypothetical protein
LLGRIGGVFSLAPYLLLLLGSILPRVEDPLPDEIGLDAPFALAAMGAALLGIFPLDSPIEKRERAMARGARIGFLLGLAFYVVALLAQVGSSV